MGSRDWAIIVAICTGFVLVSKACTGTSAAGGRYFHADAATAAERDAREPAKVFRGQPCTSDCSGHEAGYAWARAHAIDDPDACTGRSPSFVAGCRVYVTDR